MTKDEINKNTELANYILANSGFFVSDTLQIAKAFLDIAKDNEVLENHLNVCVDERIEELNVEAELFDKESWVALRTLCESQPGFSWDDFPDGMTADDAFQYLHETISILNRTNDIAWAKVDELNLKVEDSRFHEQNANNVADQLADVVAHKSHELLLLTKRSVILYDALVSLKNQAIAYASEDYVWPAVLAEVEYALADGAPETVTDIDKIRLTGQALLDSLIGTTNSDVRDAMTDFRAALEGGI